MVKFPSVEMADEHGLLAFGADLRVETLLAAYSSGIFPWPIEGITEVPWFAPPQRGVLFFHELHLSRSFRKFQRQHEYRLCFDCAFSEVIALCASVRRRQRGTWITKEIQEAYTELHRQGLAHSVECYEGERLVGGLYGVGLGGYFAAESMFHSKPNTSKLCLVHLVRHLQAQGRTWIDCQQCTPLLASFGGRDIPRADFMQLLAESLELPELCW